nr:transposase [Trinickia fusca]
MPFFFTLSIGRSVESKAKVVAACQGAGVSIAAIALRHQLNANLLRRWVEQAEGKAPGRAVTRRAQKVGAPGMSGCRRWLASRDQDTPPVKEMAGRGIMLGSNGTPKSFYFMALPFFVAHPAMPR